MNLDAIYREEIMEHYRHPHNYGKLDSFSFKVSEVNPFCGDEIEIFVKVIKAKIADVKFVGKGCSISVAGASMLTDVVKGKTLEAVEKMTRDDVIALLGIPVGAVRVKCAVLSLFALKKGIEKFKKGE